MSVLIERHYTTGELADLLHVHPETVRRLAGRGALRSIRIGQERRYSESAVRELLQLLGANPEGKSAA